MLTENETPIEDLDNMIRNREGFDDADQFYVDNPFGDSDSFDSVGWSASNAGSSVVSKDTDPLDKLIRKQLVGDCITEQVSLKNTKRCSGDWNSSDSDSSGSLGWSTSNVDSSVISDDADSFDMLISKHLADDYITEKVQSLKNTERQSADTTSTEFSSNSDTYDLINKRNKLQVIHENSFPENSSMNWSVSDIDANSISSNSDSFNVFTKKLKHDEIKQTISDTSTTTLSTTQDDSLNASSAPKNLEVQVEDHSVDDLSECETKSTARIRIEEYDEIAQSVERDGMNINNLISTKFYEHPLPSDTKLAGTPQPPMSKKLNNGKISAPPNLVDKVLVLHKSDSMKGDLNPTARRKKEKREFSKELKLILIEHGIEKPKRSHSKNPCILRVEKTNQSFEKIEDIVHESENLPPHLVREDEEKGFTRLKGEAIPSVINKCAINDSDVSTLNSDFEAEALAPKRKFKTYTSFHNETTISQQNQVEKMDHGYHQFQSNKGLIDQAGVKDDCANEALEYDPESNRCTKSKRLSTQNLRQCEILLFVLIISAAITLLVFVSLLFT